MKEPCKKQVARLELSEILRIFVPIYQLRGSRHVIRNVERV